jgi:hypothetical protein
MSATNVPTPRAADLQIELAHGSYAYVKGLLEGSPKLAESPAWADLASADAHLETARRLRREENFEGALNEGQAAYGRVYAALVKIRAGMTFARETE